MPGDARQQYEAEVRALAAACAQRLAAGATHEQVAHWAVDQRNALKQRFRALTPPADVQRLRAWTRERYGNPLGPSAAQLHAAGKSWRDIIDGAARPGLYRGAS
jgi:hypothetical protein